MASLCRTIRRNGILITPRKVVVYVDAEEDKGFFARVRDALASFLKRWVVR